MAKKVLTPADEKFLKKFFDVVYDPTTTETVVKYNRFSGEPAELNPVAAKCFDFVMQLEPILYNDAALKRLNANLTQRNAVSNFDRARYIVMKINQRAYMTLLD